MDKQKELFYEHTKLSQSVRSLGGYVQNDFDVVEMQGENFLLQLQESVKHIEADYIKYIKQLEACRQETLDLIQHQIDKREIFNLGEAVPHVLPKIIAGLSSHQKYRWGCDQLCICFLDAHDYLKFDSPTRSIKVTRSSLQLLIDTLTFIRDGHTVDCKTVGEVVTRMFNSK